MLATQNVATYYKGVIKINYKSAGGLVAGWSESIDIVAASDAAAATILTNYVNARVWTLPTTCTVVYGSIIKVPLVRYSVALANMPVVGKAASLTTANTNDMDSPQRTFCLHMIVDEGKKSIRGIHGLPDDIVVGTTIVPAAPGGTWLDLVTATTDNTANPGTFAVALKNLISYIAMQSYVASQPGTFDVGGIPTTPAFRMRAIIGLLSRDVRARPVGRPFGLLRGRQPIH